MSIFFCCINTAGIVGVPNSHLKKMGEIMRNTGTQWAQRQYPSLLHKLTFHTSGLAVCLAVEFSSHPALVGHTRCRLHGTVRLCPYWGPRKTPDSTSGSSCLSQTWHHSWQCSGGFSLLHWHSLATSGGIWHTEQVISLSLRPSPWLANVPQNNCV